MTPIIISVIIFHPPVMRRKCLIVARGLHREFPAFVDHLQLDRPQFEDRLSVQRVSFLRLALDFHAGETPLEVADLPAFADYCGDRIREDCIGVLGGFMRQ